MSEQLKLSTLTINSKPTTAPASLKQAHKPIQQASQSMLWLPLDETLAMLDVVKPNAEQTEMLVMGMQNLVGVLGSTVMGLDEPRH